MNALVHKVFDGEVLDSNEGLVQVVGAPHPLRMERVGFYRPAGLTIAELLASVPETSLPRRLVVYLNGDPIPEDLWPRVRPKPGTVLFYIARLEGGGGIRSIAMIAVAVLALVVTGGFAAPLLGGAFAAGTIGAGLLGAAITVGGTLLINTLFPIRPPKLAQDEEDRPSYSIGGAQNTANPYGTVPVVLGQHRMSPLYAAKPYTELVGDDQYLRLIFVWGYGPLSISDICIGETPIGRFQEVEIQTTDGSSTTNDPTLFPRNVQEEALSIELVYNNTPVPGGVANVRTTAPNISSISIDVTAPNGVLAISKAHGNHDNWQVVAEVRWRLTGSPTWLGPEQVVIASNRQETIRTGWRKNVTKGQYDVEVKRVSPMWTQTDVYEVVDDIYWTALRGFGDNDVLRFPKGIAVTALRIKATSQLNGTVDTLNGLVKSKQLSWHESPSQGWFMGTSSNPADLFRLVLQGPANARPVPDSKIDLTTLQSWADYCWTQGFAYNRVHEQAGSVYSVLADIAAAGRAVVLFKDGKWSVAWDDEALPVVQHFTPRNSSGFSGSRAYRRTPHAFRVRFLNEEKDFQEDEITVYDDGYSVSNATEFESIEFPGVTDWRLAHRHARFHIAQARLRPEVYKLTTDFENLVCTRGDRVRVTHDIPLWGQASGRVIDITGAVVTLDEPVVMESGKSYVLRFRSQEGYSDVRTVTTVAGEHNQITVATGASIMRVGDLWMFGETNQESVVLRVLSIEPGDDLTANLTLVDDAPAISQADKGVIPAFDSQISDPVDPTLVAPYGVAVVGFLYASGNTVLAGARVNWQVQRVGAASSYEVQLKDETVEGSIWSTVAVVAAPHTSAEIQNINSGVYSFRVRTLFSNGGFSDWTELLNVSILGLYEPPLDVTDFEVSILGEFATLTWTPVNVLNLSYYEIRFAPLLTGVTWTSAVPLRSRVYGTQVIVPAMQGTYLIKAVTQQGVPSVNALAVSTDVVGLAELNVVEDLIEVAPFAGTKVAVSYDPLRAGILLETVGDIFSFSDFFTMTDFFLGSGGFAGEGTYSFIDSVDLGDVYTSRLSALIGAYGEMLTDDFYEFGNVFEQVDWFGISPSDWDAAIEFRATNDNPAGTPTWTDWKRLVIADYTARAFQFRARLTSTQWALTPVVTDMAVRVDMPDREISMDNLAVPSGGLTVTFDPPFKFLSGLRRSDQNLQTGDYATITGQSETGFFIQFKNAAGTGVARTTDIYAKGYGKVIT